MTWGGFTFKVDSMDEIDKARGRWIRAQREARGLTRLRLANDMGVTQKAVYQWEIGVRPKVLVALLAYFGHEPGSFWPVPESDTEAPAR